MEASFIGLLTALGNTWSGCYSLIFYLLIMGKVAIASGIIGLSIYSKSRKKHKTVGGLPPLVFGKVLSWIGISLGIAINIFFIFQLGLIGPSHGLR